MGQARFPASVWAWTSALRGLFIIYATSQNEAKFRFKQQPTTIIITTKTTTIARAGD